MRPDQTRSHSADSKASRAVLGPGPLRHRRQFHEKAGPPLRQVVQLAPDARAAALPRPRFPRRAPLTSRHSPAGTGRPCRPLAPAPPVRPRRPGQWRPAGPGPGIDTRGPGPGSRTRSSWDQGRLSPASCWTASSSRSGPLRSSPMPCQAERKRPRAAPSTGATASRARARVRRRRRCRTSASHHSGSLPLGRISPRSKSPRVSSRRRTGSTWVGRKPRRAAGSRVRKGPWVRA